MKRLIIAGLFLIGSTLSFNLLLGYPSSTIKNNNQNLEYKACRIGQCQAIAKSTGNQCRHCVSNHGDLYCWQHK